MQTKEPWAHSCMNKRAAVSFFVGNSFLTYRKQHLLQHPFLIPIPLSKFYSQSHHPLTPSSLPFSSTIPLPLFHPFNQLRLLRGPNEGRSLVRIGVGFIFPCLHEVRTGITTLQSRETQKIDILQAATSEENVCNHNDKSFTTPCPIPSTHHHYFNHSLYSYDYASIHH